MTDAIDRIGQRGGKITRTLSITLQQVKRDTLRRLLADAGHAAQTVD
jgi:hypothetical protein